MFYFQDKIKTYCLFITRIIIFPLLLLPGIYSLQAQHLFTNLEDSVYSPPWIGLNTIDSGFAFSGNHFSRVDSINPFGLGIEDNFPDELKSHNTIVKISGWVKSNKAHDQLVFVFSIKDLSQTYFWKGLQLAPLINEENEWIHFTDSVLVPAFTTKKATIKAFLWNNDLQDTAGIDDLEFEFVPLNAPSFIPEIESAENAEIQSGGLIFENLSSKFVLNEKENTLVLFGNVEPLINRFLFYEKKIKKSDTVETVLSFHVVSVSKMANGNKFYLKAENRESAANLILFIPSNSLEIKCEVETFSGKNDEIVRQAIIVESAQPITEIYRANRKADTTDFQQEYWLDKEGVMFGENENTLLIYHNSEISSLQLDTEKKQLWINLDYEKDHPFLHFPLNDDTVDYTLDWSASKFNRKAKRTFHFSFFAGNIPGNLPRFMKNPSGYLATYIWTEHADYTDIRTNRAAYFGSEKIADTDSAVGGFVKFGIPVTKSIFFNNVDQISNSVISGGNFTSLSCSFIDNKDFQDFLFQLKKEHFEICLHTPEQFTTTPDQLESALEGTKKWFGSVSWIDHGYNNHSENNRENLVCDGALKKSTFFAADRWEKFGVDYFWNPYYEDFQTFNDWGYSCSMEKPYFGYGDFFPNPDFWQHKSRTAGLWHWPTKSVLYVENDALWEYDFSQEKLENFVNDWAVEINHCYPAWVDPLKGFWIYGPDSVIIAAPGFDRTLERMAKLKKEGMLNVCTVQDFLDYRLALADVSYELLTDGRIEITNHGKIQLNGLSFSTAAKYVTVDNLSPVQKIEEGNIIFWFDLAPGESKKIRVIN